MLLGYYCGVAALLVLLVNQSTSALDSSVNCTDGVCDDEEAPCPPDSAPALGPDGGPCACVKAHCTQQVCRYGSRSVLQRHGTDQPGDCCDVYECVQPKERNCSEVACPEEAACPADSYRLPSHKAPGACCSVAQGCQCLPGPCPVAACPPGRHASVVRPAGNKPGACCPLMECIEHDGNATCERDGQAAENGSEWWKDDCTLCKCNNGLIFCDISPECPDLGDQCPATRVPVGQCCPICVEGGGSEVMPRGCVTAAGKIQQNGAAWQEDACTACECVAGVKKCQAYMCEVTCVNPKFVDGECCPLCDGTSLVTLPPHCPGVNNCSLRCMHGFKRDDAGCYVIPCQCEAEQCLLECPDGYLQDRHGNKLCQCAVAACPPLTSCRKSCPHGYRINKAGCEVCKCSQCKPLNDCDKNCPHGYQVNDRDCRICKCRASVEPEGHDLISPATSEDATCMSTDGRAHDAGEAWFDGCRQCYCHSGVEMCNLITCPATECKDPVFNSSADCCPRCPDDRAGGGVGTMLCQSVDGAYRVEGETWALDEHTRCLCHAGRVLCAGSPCPPALCPHPAHAPRHGCPVCPKNKVSPGGEGCGVDRPHGAEWREDSCRSCVCDSGRVSCVTEECPAARCERPARAKNWCCAVCLDVRAPGTCQVGNVTYHTDEEWAQDACTHCVCREGAPACTEKVCSVACASPIKRPGKCCPVCPPAPPPSSFSQTACVVVIAVLLAVILAGASLWAYQRCRRRRCLVVSAGTTSHSYANYSTHTPPPQYASADRKDPHQYNYVPPYDEMLKSPTIPEKMALAPV